MKASLSVLAVLTLCAGMTHAQSILAVSHAPDAAAPAAPVAAPVVVNTPAPISEPRNEFGAWTAVGLDSPQFIGGSPGRHLIINNLRYARILLVNRRITLKYTLDVVPAAFVNQPATLYSLSNHTGWLFDPGRAEIYGAGASPVGAQINFAHHRWQPYVDGAVGFLYFAHQAPMRNSSRFNFTAGWGGGVQYFVKPTRAINFGYRFHHFSNAYTGNQNPGVDSNMLYAGFSIFK